MPRKKLLTSTMAKQHATGATAVYDLVFFNGTGEKSSENALRAMLQSDEGTDLIAVLSSYLNETKAEMSNFKSTLEAVKSTVNSVRSTVNTHSGQISTLRSSKFLKSFFQTKRKSPNNNAFKCRNE